MAEYLDTPGAAKFTQLSESYLTKLRCTGGGCPFIKVGRRCMYERSALENWLASHERASTSDGANISK